AVVAIDAFLPVSADPPLLDQRWIHARVAAETGLSLRRAPCGPCHGGRRLLGGNIVCRQTEDRQSECSGGEGSDHPWHHHRPVWEWWTRAAAPGRISVSQLAVLLQGLEH